MAERKRAKLSEQTSDRMYEMIVEEALIYGVNIVLGPEVTIKRNPLWQKF